MVASYDFYPRPPRGGRRQPQLHQRRSGYFYPRPPRGGRPDGGRDLRLGLISIHALREEGDELPRGNSEHVNEFLSTPSARRATLSIQMGNVLVTISIHALREEGDRTDLAQSRRASNFYPRPPRGGRRREADSFGSAVKFLSTPSARRATQR